VACRHYKRLLRKKGPPEIDLTILLPSAAFEFASWHLNCCGNILLARKLKVLTEQFDRTEGKEICNLDITMASSFEVNLF